MKARIYKPSKTAMQSGSAKTEFWLLEYESPSQRMPETLMGWTSSGDTLNQVKMKFSTQEEAIAFAEKKGIAYTVAKNHQKRIKPRNYADNHVYKAVDETKA